MSVATFSASELGNIAAAILNTKHRDPEATFTRVCDELALISRANVACFNDRYAHKGEDEKPATAKEIGRAIKHELSAGVYRCDLERAVSTAALLRYNCDDQGGDFTLKIEGAHAALASILEDMMDVLARKAGLTR